MIQPIITIKQGQLKGIEGLNYVGDKIYKFLGIPYAEPPIEDLKFKAPQPVKSWSGILDATKEGPECPSMHMIFNFYIGREDNCLNLNVYTKNLPHDKLNLKPVMVFIYGGGFNQGSNKSEIYGPDFLLMEDIVLVVINYRTGVLGFLSLDDSSLGVPGNAGLKDQLLALKWIQQNIENFGGHPKNVTIFGQSAGAASVHYLILSPLAKGLFHKAILQSGCALNYWAVGPKGATTIGKQLGLETTNEKEILEHLKNMSVKKLVQECFKLPDALKAGVMRNFGPVVEKPSLNAFLSDTPFNILKSGKYNKVPMIFGYTSNEGLLFEIVRILKPESVLPKDIKAEIPFNFKPNNEVQLEGMAKKIKQFYYGTEKPRAENIEKTIKLKTATVFLAAIHKAIKLHKKTSLKPIYLYTLSVKTSLSIFTKAATCTWPKLLIMVLFMVYNLTNICKDTLHKMTTFIPYKNLLGVCHGDDLLYLFKGFMTATIQRNSLEEMTIIRFVKLWTNFAKYGNPTPKNSELGVNWGPMDEDLTYLDIGKELNVLKNPNKEDLALWENLLSDFN